MAAYSAVVELTRALIRQNTINPPGNETRCNAVLRSLLEAAGFEVLEYALGEGRSNLIARIEGADKSRLPIAFTGHVDTVPLGTKTWNWDPFKAEIAEDRLYGRGSSDMKSGVAAFVGACISRRDELAKGPGVLLIITAAEETGCEGAFALTCDNSVLGVAGALIVAEPTANYPFVGHKGAIWLRAVAEGVTAHGSMPEKGVNAVLKAARAAVRLDDFDFNQKRHAVLGGPTLNVGTFHGGLNVNSVPDHAELGLDVRTVPGQPNAFVMAVIANALGNDIAVSPVLDVDAIWTEPEHPWVQQVFAILEPILGERPEVRGAPYFTDGAALKPALGNPPTIILGPGEAHMAHQTDEYCLISRIDQAVKAYIQIIDAWCCGHP